MAPNGESLPCRVLPAALLMIVLTAVVVMPQFKFGFTRMHEPTSPSWAHDPSINTATAAGVTNWPGLVVPEAAPICDSIWRWHLGQMSNPVEAKTTDGLFFGARSWWTRAPVMRGCRSAQPTS